MLKLRPIHLKDIKFLKDLSFDRENFSKLNTKMLRALLEKNDLSRRYLFILENEVLGNSGEQSQYGGNCDNNFVAFFYFEESLDDSYNFYFHFNQSYLDSKSAFYQDLYFLFYRAVQKFIGLPHKIFVSVQNDTAEEKVVKFLDFKFVSESYVARSNCVRKVFCLDLNEIFAQSVFIYPLPDSLFIYHFANFYDYRSVVKANLFRSAELFSTHNISSNCADHPHCSKDGGLLRRVLRFDQGTIQVSRLDDFIATVKPGKDGFVLLEADFIAYGRRCSSLQVRRLFYSLGLLAENGSLSKKNCRDFAKNLSLDASLQAEDYKLRVYRALDMYMNNELKVFPFNLFVEATEFQLAVWQKILQIPYGESLSYSDIGESLSFNKVINYSRAVGKACGANPLPIFLPCHRVIGKDGKITGFKGGIRNKERLLANERLLN